ncbi:MAG: hypothetical protein ACLFTK_04430 [Anaerolineales bacterium]
MHFWRNIPLVLVALLALTGAMVGYAQDDNAEFIRQAAENTQALDSYVTLIDQTIEIGLGDAMDDMFGGLGGDGEGLPGMGEGLPGMGDSMGMEVNQTIERRTDADGNSYTIVTQNLGGMFADMMGGGEDAMTVVEVVERGDQRWYRFTGDGLLTQGAPEGWFQQEDFSQPGELAVYDDIGSENPFTLSDLTAEGVSITELPGETIDGQDMRVFEIAFDEAYMRERFDEVMRGMDAVSTEGGDMADFENFVAGSTTTQRVWIGTQDNLIHRTQVVFDSGEAGLDMEGGDIPLNFSQTVTTTTNLSQFNTPVDIPDPANEV